MKTIIISLLGASTLFFSGCDNTPQGARTPSQRPAQVAMDAAKEQWHHYRAESIRHKSAGRYRESESCDRLADGAYDQYNMYYHRIQIGDFSLIPTAAEEQSIRNAEAADNARRASDAAAAAYAIWVIKADAIAREAGFADWRAKANADDEIVRLAADAKRKSYAEAHARAEGFADLLAKTKHEEEAAIAKAEYIAAINAGLAAKRKSDADAEDPKLKELKGALAAADAKYEADVSARAAAKAAK